MSMNPEVKSLWVSALRSGQYPQCRGELRNSSGLGYCCLGVLSQLAVDAGVQKEPYIGPMTGFSSLEYQTYWYPSENGSEFAALTEETRKWAGLLDADPHVEFIDPSDPGSTETTRDSLAGLNDDWELDFSQIADIIERDDKI